MNNSSIPLIPGTDDCGNFESGTAFSYFGGLFYSYNYLPDELSFDIRLFYERRPVDLSAISNGYEVLSPINNQYVPLVREHLYSGSLEYLALDFGVKYKPFKDYPIWLRLGAEAGNPIISSNYSNTEQIVSPQGVLFPNERLSNEIASGRINDAGTSYAINLGVSFYHKLNSGLIVEPGLTYRKSINSVVSSSVWNQDIIRLSLALGIDFSNDDPQIEKPTNNKIVEEFKIIEKEMSIVSNLSATEINIQETIVTQTYPILPYIFFDSLSHEIKEVYLSKASSKNFNEIDLPKDNLEIYYRILDIIGSRMVKFSNANLTIIGTQDGSESIAFPNNSIADRRAIIIFDYLNQKWGINRDRIHVSKQKKPTLSTSESYYEGFQENRRVEFTSDDPRMFEPVIHTKFSEYTPISNNLVLSSSFTNNIDSWSIDFLYENDKIKSITGVSQTIPSNFSISELFEGKIIEPNKTFQMNVTVYKDGKKEIHNRTIPIITNTNKFELGRLNLIVFDFDKSELTDFNMKMIENFAASSISQDSKIEITGTTDRLGDDNYNLKLSSMRAESVKGLLKNLIPDLPTVSNKGIGANKLPYNNDLPEGRFYSRTVLIEVRTPIK